MGPEAVKSITKEMTVGEILRVHPAAGYVFASYHLGGCSHCSISEEETLDQICMGYGIPVDQILGDLNRLLESQPQAQESQPSAPSPQPQA